MKTEFATAMGRALDQVRAGDPAGATRAIQDLLRGQGAGTSGRPAAQEAPRPAPAASPDGIEEAEVLGGRPARDPQAQAAPAAATAPRATGWGPRSMRSAGCGPRASPPPAPDGRPSLPFPRAPGSSGSITRAPAAPATTGSMCPRRGRRVGRGSS